MKKILLYSMCFIALLSFASCQSKEETVTPESMPVVEASEAPTEENLVEPTVLYEKDGRKFSVEQQPSNEIEQMVVDYYYNNFVGDFAKNIIRDSYFEEINAEEYVARRQEPFDENIRLAEQTINWVSVISAEEYTDPEADFFVPSVMVETEVFVEDVAEAMEQMGLKEYYVVGVKYTQTYTEEAFARGPQDGNGTLCRYVIVAQDPSDDEMKFVDWSAFMGEGQGNFIGENPNPHNN